MKKHNKLYLLLTLILILILGISGWYLYKGNLPFIAKPKTNQTKTAILSPKAQEIKKVITKTDKKVGDLVSDYKEYRINYLISNDQYIVIIKEEPFTESKKKAENWFLGQGFKQEDLCALKILFTAAPGINGGNSTKDASPTGCL